jgi:RNA polymerase sigma factor (sigma-70 family)
MRQKTGMEYKDDIYYIGEVLNGKTNAFSHIVDQHKDNVFNLAFRICGNREEAEEVAQDSFLKAFRSLNGFRMKSSFSTWLYRIVYNTSISFLRSRKKGMISIDEYPATVRDFIASDTPEEVAELKYRESLVNFALQKMPEDERALVTLYYYDELSSDEISEIMQISKSNIKVRLFRARKRICEIIEKIEKSNLICHE